MKQKYLMQNIELVHTFEGFHLVIFAVEQAALHISF